MTHPIYSRDHLKNFSRGQLHDICDKLSLPRRRSCEDCISDILTSQPQLVAEQLQQPRIPTRENPFTVEQAAESGYIFSYAGVGNFLAIKGYNEQGMVVVNDGYDDLIFSAKKIEFMTYDKVVAASHVKEEAVADEQTIAQAELNNYIDQQAQDIARLEINQQGYKDAIIGIPEQSTDPCYRVGYDRGLRDAAPQTEDSFSQAITFEEIGKTIYGKVWGATVNGVEIRIVPVNGGYKSNLTSDRLLVDFGIAVKETLLAVAEIQSQETKPEMEVYTTAHEGVYAVYSSKVKVGQTNRYEVDLNQQTCTCPHHRYRHEQERFVDKHIEMVKTALRMRETPLIREEEMLLDKPFDELSVADLERLACYSLLPELVAA